VSWLPTAKNFVDFSQMKFFVTEKKEQPFIYLK
jgi:hypothetical protein